MLDPDHAIQRYISNKHKIPINSSYIQDSCLLELHLERMEDIIGAHLEEADLDLEGVQRLDYSDVFPEDLDARPNSFDAILAKELEKVDEAGTYTLHEAYTAARAAYEAIHGIEVQEETP